MTPERKAVLDESLRPVPETGYPDRRSPARSRSAHVDATAATERRCLFAERVVLTAVALAMLVAFFLRGGCIECEQRMRAMPPAPAAGEVFGWPI
jgi:hypothetical protein